MRDDEYYRNKANAERRERRERSRRKYIIANTLIAIAILAVIIGAVFLVVSLVNKNKPATDATSPAVVATEETQKATEAPATAAPIETKPRATQPQIPTQAQQETPSETQQATNTTATGAAAPDASKASVLHYYANGKTTEGYNWDYSGGGGVVSINCTYDFSKQQYDFTITGVAPGTTSFTLMYWTGDNQTVSVPMTVTVADDLSVTQVG